MEDDRARLLAMTLGEIAAEFDNRDLTGLSSVCLDASHELNKAALKIEGLQESLKNLTTIYMQVRESAARVQMPTVRGVKVPDIST